MYTLYYHTNKKHINFPHCLINGWYNIPASGKNVPSGLNLNKSGFLLSLASSDPFFSETTHSTRSHNPS